MPKTKNLTKISLLAFCLVTLGFISFRAAAQSIPQGYTAKETIQPGILVQLVPKSNNEVEPVSQANAIKTLGVDINPNEAPESLSGNSNAPQTYVATSGEYPVLVSTQNGNIADGDYITVSAINGVGMIAGSTDVAAIGRAASVFNGKTGVVSTTTLTNSLHRQQTVQIGYVLVNLAVGRNPLYAPANGAAVPSFLETAAKDVTGRPVTALRIYISLVVLIVTLIVAGSVMYIGIRSAITAIGRNPLAKKTISKSMASVIISALIVFIIGIVAVYLLLKL